MGVRRGLSDGMVLGLSGGQPRRGRLRGERLYTFASRSHLGSQLLQRMAHRRAPAPPHRLAGPGHGDLRSLRGIRLLAGLGRPRSHGGRMDRPRRSAPREPQIQAGGGKGTRGDRRQPDDAARRRPRRSRVRLRARVRVRRRHDVEGVEARDPRGTPGPLFRDGPQRRLRRRRPEGPPPRHHQEAHRSAGGRPRDGVHPRGSLDHRRQAGTGFSDASRARQARLGVRHRSITG